MRTSDSGATVQLLLTRDLLNALDQSHKDELAALARVVRAEIYRRDSEARVGFGLLPLVMELDATSENV